MKITSKNVEIIGSSIALSITVLFTIWLVKIGYTTSADFLTKIFPIFIVFVCLLAVLRFIVVLALSLAFNVIPLTFGTYTNTHYGFSIDFPNEWEDATKEKNHYPELVVQARDKKRFAAINIIAGPQNYGTNPSTEDIEIQARRNVENLHGTLESVQRIKIDGDESVMVVYSALSMKTKKIGLIKNNMEFIITCSSAPDIFSLYEPVFDETIQSMKWIPVK